MGGQRDPGHRAPCYYARGGHCPPSTAAGAKAEAVGEGDPGG
eukprot:gene1880-4296_t